MEKRAKELANKEDPQQEEAEHGKWPMHKSNPGKCLDCGRRVYLCDEPGFLFGRRVLFVDFTALAWPWSAWCSSSRVPP